MDPTIDAQVVVIVETATASLQRYVRTMVRDSDEAADVTQEACLRLLTAARANGLPDCPEAWLRRVARNLVVSSVRRRQTATRYADRLAERGVVPALEQGIVDRERHDAVRLALKIARTDDRDAIVMAANGFATREIAARLGRSEIATRTHLSRARGRLRERLAAAGAM